MNLEKALKEIEEKEKELKASEEALLALGENITDEDKANLEGIRYNLELISQKKAETSKGLETVSAKMLEIEKEENTLKSKKSELVAQEQEVKTGKLQIDHGKWIRQKLNWKVERKTLDEEIEEFESAKKEAFKKASLDDAISPEMISGILAAQNFSMPAGYVSNEEGIKHLVKVGDKIKDETEMENLLLFDTGEDANWENLFKRCCKYSL